MSTWMLVFHCKMISIEKQFRNTELSMTSSLLTTVSLTQPKKLNTTSIVEYR